MMNKDVKEYHVLTLNKHTLRINKRRLDNFVAGCLRLFLSFIAVLSAVGIGSLSARIEMGYYPKTLPTGDVITMGDALFCLVIISLALPGLFWFLARMCRWED